MKRTIDSNVATVRNHYNRFFDLLDRGKMFAEEGWTKRPPIINLGYWSRGATTARDAQVAFVHELASRLPSLRGRRVLDVGCGVAGPATLLAADHGALVDGININEQQVEWARKFISGNGLEDRIRIHVASSMEIPFQNEFDVVFCLESAHCYADKARFLSGAWNALRPGGKLLLADIVGTSHFPPFSYQPALHLHLITAKDWQRLMEAALFQVESCELVGNSVYPGYRRWLGETAGERRSQMLNRLCSPGAGSLVRQTRRVQAWGVELMLCRSVLPTLSWLRLREYVVIVAGKPEPAA